MVTVKLHGMPYSACAHRVWATAQEIGVTVELVPVDLAKVEHKTPEYVENYHPFGVIPVLVDEDGTKLFESRAICRYLVAKYGKGSPLLPDPSDAKAYGLFEQAASIEYSNFDPSAASLTYERIVAPMRKEKPNEELIKKCIDTLISKMDGYERILSKQKYLAGDTFTLADLFHLPYGQIISVIEPRILASKPHVKAWWDDISARESWKATLKFSGH
ncbi:Glutathione S-transferase, partial [Rhizoctonia solani AG-8 WAC10335]